MWYRLFMNNYYEKSPQEEILSDAMRITRERGKSYGPPEEHFARTVGAIRAIFGDMPMNQMQVEDWAFMMVIDKISRDREVPAYDSLADIIGYTACAHRIRKLGEGKTQSTDDGKNSTS